MQSYSQPIHDCKTNTLHVLSLLFRSMSLVQIYCSIFFLSPPHHSVSISATASTNYFIPKSRRPRSIWYPSNNFESPSWRICFRFLLELICLLFAFHLLILPEPNTLKRFLADDLVLIPLVVVGVVVGVGVGRWRERFEKEERIEVDGNTVREIERATNDCKIIFVNLVKWLFEEFWVSWWVSISRKFKFSHLHPAPPVAIIIGWPEVTRISASNPIELRSLTSHSAAALQSSA